eukprot:IDg5926t1
MVRRGVEVGSSSLLRDWVGVYAGGCGCKSEARQLLRADENEYKGWYEGVEFDMFIAFHARCLPLDEPLSLPTDSPSVTTSRLRITGMIPAAGSIFSDGLKLPSWRCPAERLVLPATGAS